MLYKFGLIIGIVILWIIGGQKSNRWRDVGVPILLGMGIWLATKSWFVGVVSIGLWQIIRLGYGNYEKGEKNSFLGDLTKDRQGALIRTLYGLIVSLVGCGVLFALKQLSLPKSIFYISGNAIIGYLVSKLRFPVLLADVCISAGFGSILLLI